VVDAIGALYAPLEGFTVCNRNTKERTPEHVTGGEHMMVSMGTNLSENSETSVGGNWKARAINCMQRNRVDTYYSQRATITAGNIPGPKDNRDSVIGHVSNDILTVAVGAHGEARVKRGEWLGECGCWSSLGGRDETGNRACGCEWRPVDRLSLATLPENIGPALCESQKQFHVAQFCL